MIFRFSISWTGTRHDFLDLPSTRTVQAPQSLTPQPYFVAVSPRLSLRIHSKGVSGNTSTLWSFPFTLRVKLSNIHSLYTGISQIVIQKSREAECYSSGVLEVSGVSKTFGSTVALAKVGLTLRKGSVHALVGENGAGKSTLIGIMSGSLACDEGSMTLGGAPYSPANICDAENRGVAHVHQEAQTFPDLTVEQNIFVGRESTRWGTLDRRTMQERARAALNELGCDLRLSARLSDLSFAQHQLTAIARAMVLDCQILILDEPTASLSVKESTALHQVIHRLRNSGRSVLFVSHRLEEVMELADETTVLRDGTRTAHLFAAETDKGKLVSLMTGRDISKPAYETESSPGPVALEVRGLERKGLFGPVSFSVREGEIVGLGGLVGSGRSEIVECVFGLQRPTQGHVSVQGECLSAGDVRASIRAGLALVPESRQKQGLVAGRSILDNLNDVTRAVGKSWISFHKDKQSAENLIEGLKVKARSATTSVSELSGGNQQKVLLGKWLATKPNVLILDEPTRGVDIGAKGEIHALIRRLAADGLAVLVVSSDLPELIALSDRILVVRAGKAAGELSRTEATEESVLAMAFGTEGAA